MKILIPSDGNKPGANVSRMLGTARYLIIADSETADLEAIPNPGAGGRGGVNAVALAVARDTDLVLTGYCAPAIEAHLLNSGIRVVTGISGTVSEAVERFKGNPSENARQPLKKRLPPALKKSLRQFSQMLPMMLSIVLLAGFLNTFISDAGLTALFSGSALRDTLAGGLTGSLFAGNAVNSYIIGKELLDNGVSLFAVTAFIMAWATVGIIQLPAEAAALGKRFAILRTLLTFLLALAVALLTVTILNLMGSPVQ
ncbi:hypothetical protein DENIS_0085 [Desulfonema ishimotonii]|uniref:Dinitrogenase iron-molybdenum cofactor biosynthesis domain-containing protein n=1 Tax=Desulfonema ishimotonii TaxID=45657 RepID=A0A401FQ83_9BACT|nr:NifB/NifX family molybdenum-iron cluster-binding protein [Desulfonema ishimotonii]GBC59149.1 hypothetical protein DENIS_0085 [Desulfonema ishimotonii]